MNTVITKSGARLDTDAPAIDALRLPDIAHHLSHQCRYHGATARYYSEAEHAMLFAQIVRDKYHGSPRHALAALLHNAYRAYMPSRMIAVHLGGAALASQMQARHRIQHVLLAYHGVAQHADCPVLHMAHATTVATELTHLAPHLLSDLCPPLFRPPPPEPWRPETHAHKTPADWADAWLTAARLLQATLIDEATE